MVSGIINLVNNNCRNIIKANNALDNGMKVNQILATKSKDRLGEVKFIKDHEKLLDELGKKMEQELKAQ